MKFTAHIAAGLLFLIMGITGVHAQPVTKNGRGENYTPAKDASFLIKTNLIYDALLSPSIELEYRIAPHWSILADYSIAWWSQKDKHLYYQLTQLSPEIRYWFNADKAWRGHYMGIFAGGGHYDLGNELGGYQGKGIMSGISYGYMFPIGQRLSFDAGIGVGAMSTTYEEYKPLDGHYVYQQTSRTNYIGPLKLRFALTWQIGSRKDGKTDKKSKGGKL